MKYDTYRDLIRRLEAAAARDPKGFTLRVGAFGVLGYVYIVTVFAGLLSLVLIGPRLRSFPGSWLSFKLGLVLVPMGLVFLRTLLRRVSAPQGVALVRERVPALFAAIDDVARMLRSPRPHRVLLTPHYNCSLMQRPRLGVFGWPENILTLGLPMLEALSPARFRAVLAHELGHLAAQHGTFGGRLHAVSEAWQVLLHRLSSRQSLLLHVFELFFRWYGPRFQAMGFVLGRRQEYFADHCSRRAAGVRATRGALVRIDVMARRYRETMDQAFHTRVKTHSTPPGDLVPQVALQMREDLPHELAQKWIDEALRAETGYEHTHPALRDRLAAVEPQSIPSVADALAEPGASAAQELLGAELESLTRDVSAIWTAEVTGVWKHRHNQLADAARTANAPPDGDDASTGSHDAAWNTVAARIELDGDQAAREHLAAFLEAHADHAVAHYRMGQVLLEGGEFKGLEHLERAMQLDSDATPSSCRLAIDYLRSQGRGREAEDFTRRAWEFSELAHKAEHERRYLRRNDVFVAHGLPAEEIAALTERLSQESWIAAAYFVRKQVKFRPEKPCYVLGLTWHRTWYKLADPLKERKQALALFHEDVVPAGTWMFFLEGNLRWAAARLGRVEGALVWVRPKRRAAEVTKAA